MPKLWIVHRSPQQRATLARLAGLAETDVVEGAPNNDSKFADSQAPAAVLLSLDGDFELELDFVHRHRAQLSRTRWLLLTQPEDADEALRLFRAVEPEIQKGPISARTLRAFIAAAISHRNAASLAERQHRQRISDRFSLWLGGVEVPGLLRALDPSLARLPLLVRGAQGSGRSLLCHYVEIFRGARGHVLRLHAKDLRAPNALLDRLSEIERNASGALRSVWIDEIDSLPIAEQRELAEMIVHGSAEVDLDTTRLRWIATAGPSGLEDRLESSLEHAFAPLSIEVPSLLDHPETLATFAAEVARDWTRSVGGVPREFADSALLTLETHPWTGDRAELEAVLRTSLAASSREVLEDVDLRFPSDRDPWTASSDTTPRTRSGGERIPDPTGPPEVDSLEALIEIEATDEPIHSTAAVPIEDAREISALGDERGNRSEAVVPDSDEFDTDDRSDNTDPINPIDPIDDAVFADPSERISAPAEDSGPDESMKLAEASFGLASESSELMRAPKPAAEADDGLGWRRLARSLSHEIRNPLVSIRTFAELLPEHFEDETFRARFTELVGRDVAHISSVLTRLSSIAEREKFEAEPVDVSALIEELLEERRERITRGRLLVLRELERDAPLAWADSRGLQIALAGLLDRALESLPERGDLFVATRHLDRGADGRSKLRILLRHHNPSAGHASDSGLAELDPRANILEYVLAETVITSCGGTLTIDATDAQETLILVDLQTPI